MDVAVPLTSLSHGAGCGCKLPAADLLPIVRGLPPATAPELLVGSATGDDAGVWRISVELVLEDARAMSGGSRHNREYAEGFAYFAAGVAPWRVRLLCDATTSGGLLVAVDPARAGELPGPVVGRLVAGDPGAIAVA